MNTPSIDVTYYSELVAIVTLRGEHDLVQRPQLVEALEAAGSKHNVLVDFSQCTFAGSSVISALLQAAPRLQRGGGALQLIIPAPRPAIRRVFDLLGIQRDLPIHTTVAAAIDYIGSARSAGVQKTRTGMRLGIIAVLSLEPSTDYEPPLPKA